jgi:hypothetical protein
MGHQDMFGNVIDPFLFPVAHCLFPYPENKCPPLAGTRLNQGADFRKGLQYYFLSAVGTSG